MNVQGTGALSDVQVAQITQDVADLLQDADLRTAVVVEVATGETIDAASGLVSTAVEQTSTTGYLSPVELAEVAQSGDRLQIGDVHFLVPAAAFTTAPVIGATVRASNTRYAVVHVGTDALGLHHDLVCRRTGT